MVVSFGIPIHFICDASSDTQKCGTMGYIHAVQLSLVQTGPSAIFVNLRRQTRTPLLKEFYGDSRMFLLKEIKCNCNSCRHPLDCQRKRHRKQLDFLGKSSWLSTLQNNGTGEAAALSTLHMMDMSDHVFHRHCFIGELQELRQWQRESSHVMSRDMVNEICTGPDRVWYSVNTPRTVFARDRRLSLPSASGFIP
jgi:hypothetical protein